MILVLDHNPEWAKSFEHEASRIVAALGVTLVNIHHIGSTSITYTKAKPVIDILLEVSSLDELDQQSASLQALGYEAKGEFGIPGRRYFRLDDAKWCKGFSLCKWRATAIVACCHRTRQTIFSAVLVGTLLLLLQSATTELRPPQHRIDLI
jgi:GrpB-like predicted nucleotidyltransferase (UPF0157 family)